MSYKRKSIKKPIVPKPPEPEPIMIVVTKARKKLDKIMLEFKKLHDLTDDKARTWKFDYAANADPQAALLESLRLIKQDIEKEKEETLPFEGQVIDITKEM